MSQPLCPKCKSEMELKHGSRGQFWDCVRYPECKGSATADSPVNLNDEQQRSAQEMTAIALAFVRQCGGITRAKRWLSVAEAITEAMTQYPEATPASSEPAPRNTHLEPTEPQK